MHIHYIYLFVFGWWGAAMITVVILDTGGDRWYHVLPCAACMAKIYFLTLSGHKVWQEIWNYVWTLQKGKDPLALRKDQRIQLVVKSMLGDFPATNGAGCWTKYMTSWRSFNWLSEKKSCHDFLGASLKSLETMWALFFLVEKSDLSPSRWWFQIFFMFILFGEDSHVDSYFSNGWFNQPPTSNWLTFFLGWVCGRRFWLSVRLPPLTEVTEEAVRQGEGGFLWILVTLRNSL